MRWGVQIPTNSEFRSVRWARRWRRTCAGDNRSTSAVIDSRATSRKSGVRSGDDLGVGRQCNREYVVLCWFNLCTMLISTGGDHRDGLNEGSGTRYNGGGSSRTCPNQLNAKAMDSTVECYARRNCNRKSQLAALGTKIVQMNVSYRPCSGSSSRCLVEGFRLGRSHPSRR